MNWMRVVGIALLACGLSVSRASAADDAAARLEAGKAFLTEGKREEAIKAFQEVVADKAATPDQQAEAQLRIGHGLYDSRRYTYADAIPEYRKVIENYPAAPVDIRVEAQLYVGHAYCNLHNYAAAIPEFRKVTENYPTAPVDVLADAQRSVGHACYNLGKYQDVVAECRRAIENYPTASVAILADAQRYVGHAYCNLGNYQEAIPEYRKVIEKYPTASVGILADAQRSIGSACVAVGQHQEAITEYRKVIENYPAAGVAILADAQLCMGNSHVELGKWPEAERAYVQAVKLFPPPEAITALRGGLSKVIGAPDSTVGVLDVTRDLRVVMLGNTADRTTREAIQALIVDLLLDQGQFDAALGEARILMQVSVPDNVAKAGERLTMALKGKDGNLVRVNQFIKYQKWGRAGEDGQAGTADDLADPLASVTFPGSEDRDKQFSEVLTKLPTDWAGRLARANLFRYWGKPREALKELKMAFALCPTEQQALQNITDGIAQVLCQLSGDPKAGERFVAFLNQGAAGPDGQPGTADDLVDPLAEYAEQ